MDIAHFSSPLGVISVSANDQGVTSLSIGGNQEPGGSANPHIRAAKVQLDEYFAGQRKTFDIACILHGTAFQKEIWKALEGIPYGRTLTYGELATKIGRPGSARAVGGAVGANPIPIIIPCHRVMGSSGAITGYSAGDGVTTKKALLDLEVISYR
jgi:methylated-DNA-[protein]-cysteine S-methyltransferase